MNFEFKATLKEYLKAPTASTKVRWIQLQNVLRLALRIINADPRNMLTITLLTRIQIWVMIVVKG